MRTEEAFMREVDFELIRGKELLLKQIAWVWANVKRKLLIFFLKTHDSAANDYYVACFFDYCMICSQAASRFYLLIDGFLQFLAENLDLSYFGWRQDSFSFKNRLTHAVKISRDSPSIECSSTQARLEFLSIWTLKYERVDTFLNRFVQSMGCKNAPRHIRFRMSRTKNEWWGD